MDLGEPLRSHFFNRHTVKVACGILGKILSVRSNGKLYFARIVETEAYRSNDEASHSSKGLTSRTQVMFGPAGHVYIYFIYGNHEMLNFVTEKEGNPGAVLIRAVEPLSGTNQMIKNRGFEEKGLSVDLSNGPGKLTMALEITRKMNGLSVDGETVKIYRGCKPKEPIFVSPRVGIREATDRNWRFFLKGSPYVSRVPENKNAKALSEIGIRSLVGAYV